VNYAFLGQYFLPSALHLIWRCSKSSALIALSFVTFAAQQYSFSAFSIATGFASC
jgi:hypothetical protein